MWVADNKMLLLLLLVTVPGFTERRGCLRFSMDFYDAEPQVALFSPQKDITR